MKRPEIPANLSKALHSITYDSDGDAYIVFEGKEYGFEPLSFTLIARRFIDVLAGEYVRWRG